eukprot:gene10199-biopygen7419
MHRIGAMRCPASEQGCREPDTHPVRLTPQPYLGLVPPSALRVRGGNDGPDHQARRPQQPVFAPASTPRPYLGLVPPSQTSGKIGIPMSSHLDGEQRRGIHPRSNADPRGYAAICRLQI